MLYDYKRERLRMNIVYPKIVLYVMKVVTSKNSRALLGSFKTRREVVRGG